MKGFFYLCDIESTIAEKSYFHCFGISQEAFMLSLFYLTHWHCVSDERRRGVTTIKA